MGEAFDEMQKYEWICTNGIGGYALGSRDLINRRKYHGLLIASYRNLKRVHLVSSIEEKFIINGNAKYVDSNIYYDVIYPMGFKKMIKSWIRPYPAFLYNLTGDINEPSLLSKEIFMKKGSNLVVVRYTNLSNIDVGFELRPKFSIRDHHWVNKLGIYESIPIYTEAGARNNCSFGYLRRTDFDHGEVYFFTNYGQIIENLLIFRNVFYPAEAERGYDAYEDLISPFLHRGIVKGGEAIELVFSDVQISKEICDSASFGQLIKKTVDRYKKLPFPGDANKYLSFTRESLPYMRVKADEDRPFPKAEYNQILETMLEDFKIRSDVIAGYPWFSAWGRDTMISLEAFLIYPEKYLDFAVMILDLYGSQLKNGILPNVKGEGGRGKNYDTVDASLWYIQRVNEIFDLLDENRQVRLFKYVCEIVCNYLFNESLSFYFDKKDNLICIRGGTNKALTWMDAKIDGKPVTPRYGKPVEINGLWYSGLMCVAEMALKLGENMISLDEYSIDVDELNQISNVIKNNMKRYFANNLWLDLLDGDRSEAEEIRPNFVIALSLPHDFAEHDSLDRGCKIAQEKLLTPFGLRSLSVDSPNFAGTYSGDQRTRDMAYHQGTVWTWLLMPYAKLLKKVISDKENLKKELVSVISTLREMIQKGIISSVAEVWDGNNPAFPKGAPAQAWSVAAVYYIENMIEKL